MGDTFKEKLTDSRKKIPNVSAQYADLGRIPPQLVHVEQAVLGAILLEKDALVEVLDILNPDVFYKEEHKEIYRSIIKLFEETKPIDILTVTQDLRSREKLEYVGGAFYISELTNSVASSANIEFHSRLLVEKFILRELIRISSDIQQQAFDDATDVFTLLDKSENDLFSVSQGNLKGSYKPMSTLISESILSIEEIAKNSQTVGISGVATGFTGLDRFTSGWQASDLIILASRPGMGKTSFALTMARNAAIDFGKSVAVFSLEMSSIQLVNRLIAAEAELDSEKLRSGNLADHEWAQLHSRIDQLSKAKIFIDDTPGINVFELRAKCRRLKSQHKIDIIFVDYLQLMNAHSDQRKNMNREQEISAISRALKGMAKDLKVPVIALSQLSREVERRTVKKPMLSDLRESGSIEQDADQVLFIYRPDYYEGAEDENQNPVNGIAEIIIAKNRHGKTGKVELKWIGKYAKFANSDYFTLAADSSGTISRYSKASDEEEETTPF